MDPATTAARTCCWCGKKDGAVLRPTTALEQQYITDVRTGKSPEWACRNNELCRLRLTRRLMPVFATR